MGNPSNTQTFCFYPDGGHGRVFNGAAIDGAKGLDGAVAPVGTGPVERESRWHARGDRDANWQGRNMDLALELIRASETLAARKSWRIVVNFASWMAAVKQNLP